MVRVDVPLLETGVDDAPLLDVQGGIVRQEVEIVAALVAVGPEDHARMVDVPHHQLTGQLVAHLLAVERGPSGEFVDDVQAQRVADVQERPVGRVV